VEILALIYDWKRTQREPIGATRREASVGPEKGRIPTKWRDGRRQEKSRVLISVFLNRHETHKHTTFAKPTVLNVKTGGKYIFIWCHTTGLLT
jgi:hypothetical protein